MALVDQEPGGHEAKAIRGSCYGYASHFSTSSYRADIPLNVRPTAVFFRTASSPAEAANEISSERGAIAGKENGSPESLKSRASRIGPARPSQGLRR
jgi:hypothetical protein